VRRRARRSSATRFASRFALRARAAAPPARFAVPRFVRPDPRFVPDRLDMNARLQVCVRTNSRCAVAVCVDARQASSIGRAEARRRPGAEVCAPDGEHLAHLLALAVEWRLTIAELLRMHFYHPTVEEALRSALRDAAKKLPGKVAPDLAFCERPAAAALD
jgi:dihydrolipoamide dehydrogenase